MQWDTRWDLMDCVALAAQVRAARKEIEQQQERLVKAWDQVEGARLGAGLPVSGEKQVRGHPAHTGGMEWIIMCAVKPVFLTST